MLLSQRSRLEIVCVCVCVCVFPVFNLFSVCARVFLTGIMYSLHILHVCDADSREIRHGCRRQQHVMHGGEKNSLRKGYLGGWRGRLEGEGEAEDTCPRSNAHSSRQNQRRSRRCQSSLELGRSLFEEITLESQQSL